MKKYTVVTQNGFKHTVFCEDIGFHPQTGQSIFMDKNRVTVAMFSDVKRLYLEVKDLTDTSGGLLISLVTAEGSLIAGMQGIGTHGDARPNEFKVI